MYSLFLCQGHECHLVAREVVALDESLSMRTMWGVKSFAMVEESEFIELPDPVLSMIYIMIYDFMDMDILPSVIYIDYRGPI